STADGPLSAVQPLHLSFQLVDSAVQLLHWEFQPLHSAAQPLHSDFQLVDSTVQPLHLGFQLVAWTVQPLHSAVRPLHSNFQRVQRTVQLLLSASQRLGVSAPLGDQPIEARCPARSHIRCSLCPRRYVKMCAGTFRNRTGLWGKSTVPKSLSSRVTR